MRSVTRAIKVVLFVFSVIILTLIVVNPVFAQEECFVCHGQTGFTTTIEGKGVSLYVDADRYADKAHTNVKCTGCHIGFTEGPHGDEAMATYKQVAGWACQKCHSGSYNRYMKGSHGRAYNKGEAAAPTCIKCHSNHYIDKSSDPESAISYLKAPEENCGKCHEEPLELYLDGYHGKTLVVLGYAKSASCSKCHDAHEAKPLKTDSDKISACRPCHPSANENFVGFLVHPNENDRVGEPLLFYVKWIMTTLLIVVLAFFYSHTVLWAYRDTVERRKKRGEER